MYDKNILTYRLETHETKDILDNHTNGKLTVIWRDWDKIIEYQPKMAYISYVNSGEIKGPHIHTKRTSHFVCIQGKVAFIVKDDNGKYNEIESGEDDPVLVRIPKNIPSAHINLSKNASAILALADIAWRPNDNEMENTTFDDYDWKKWESRKD
tara:strand:- start:1700 stop:2161 length:462 start_codon:yes stop_codon:yes gene_type:complete